MKRTRIAVIGAGFIGETHVKALKALPQVDLVAICDIDQTRVTDISQRYEIAGRFTSIEPMLAESSPEGVIIATPDDQHRVPVETVAKAGVHILLEKPIATSLPDAEALLLATQSNNVKLQIGFTLRYSPTFIDFHHRMNSGWFGTLNMGHTRRVCPQREARRLGGRVTANQYLAVHDIDLMLWFFGQELTEVYAVRGEFDLFNELGVADYYWTTLQWKSGAIATIYASWAMPDGTPNYVETELLLSGSKAAAHFDWRGQVVRLFDEHSFCTQEVFPNIYLLQDQAFVQAIINDTRPFPSGEDGLNALKVVEAAELSATKGTPIQIQL